MIDARIAELKRMWSGGANDCILSTIHELEQVRQKVVEIAKAMEKLRGIAARDHITVTKNRVSSDPEYLEKSYNETLGKMVAYDTCIDLVGSG